MSEHNMQLPLPPVETHKVQLWSIKEPVRFRPFTVKEQKILLHAKGSEDQETIIDAISQIIRLCTFDKVNPYQLPTFDIEKLFINIRAKSVSEEFKLRYKFTPKKVEGSEEEPKEELITLTIPLDKIDFVEHEGHSTLIKLTDTYAFKMKYPTIEQLLKASKIKSDDFDATMNSIEQIIDGDNVYNLSDFTEEQKVMWFDSLDTHASLKIKEFFDTMPSVEYKTKIKTKSSVEIPIHLKGINDFFI